MRRFADLTVLSACLLVATANAAWPPPANDTPATAAPLSAVPAVVEGSNVSGDDTISTTTLPGLANVPGADVFYTFTPAATGSYWVVMIPWLQVPVYASSGASVPVPNLCVYVREAGTGTFVAGSDANPVGQPDTVVTTLTAGTAYELVVDSTETVARGQQFEFTLVLAAAPVPAEDCASGASIAFDLPAAVVGTLTGAVDDFTFVEGTGRCDVADPAGTFTPGPDHVYSFTTGSDPADAGDYVFNLIPGGTGWDGFIYIADSCPPFLPLGCLGAASHSSNTVRQSEAVVVTLDYDTTYYVYVDAATTNLPNAQYTLLVDHAASYGISEVEPNEAPAEAAPVATDGSPTGGQIVGALDEDVWSIVAGAGDKLYAFLDNGNTSLSSIDSELRVFDVDGSTLIEFDDDDGEGGTSPVPTLVYRSSSFSATIAGAPLFNGGTYYLKADSGGIGTLARYRLHHGLEPAGRAPRPEVEPNGSLGFADDSGKAFYFGTIDPAADVDTYSFTATAGTRVYVALDGDPERNSGGDDPNDALALDGALKVYDPAGDVLITEVDDLNGVEATQLPDYPAEALVFTAPVTGTYYVEVSGGGAADYGPDRTYELAIFKNDLAPNLSEDVDPVIDSMTPDFANDRVLVAVSDDVSGDSGLCAVALAADSDNLTLSGVVFPPGAATASFYIELINPAVSGTGKVVITDCAGNTAAAAVTIDAGAPVCGGSVVVPAGRVFYSTHPPLHAPDNQPTGPGINGTIDVAAPGTLTDVNVTLTTEGSSVNDLDVFLESPAGTRVELFTDRGSSSAYNVIDARFDDAGAAIMSLLSSDEPYTGTWKPEVGTLAALNGQAAQGTWKLNVIDDSSNSSGGSRLVRWSLDLVAGFANPEEFQGTATDNTGIQSVELTDPDNVALQLPPDFTPGDLSVAFTVRLLDTSKPGTGTVVVTDISENTCQTEVALDGLPDATAPVVTGAASRNIVFGGEAQLDVPSANPAGAVATVTVPQSLPVGEVEVDLTVNTKDVGRIAATFGHAGEFAALLNRTGMDERGSVGLTKDNFELTFDDDAPVVDDAHLEPALGTIEFMGLHQPDGRGEFVGDGITSDYRDNMLFALEGLDSAGDWTLYVADFREQGASSARSIFRRWQATVRSPGGPERYVGHARDIAPQAGLCSIGLASGATNLVVSADFDPLAEEADFVVELIDPTQPGSGTVEITDCAGNVTSVPVSLAAALEDQSLPVVSGAVNPATFQFEGLAADNQPGDSGIAAVALAPHSDNLQIVSVTPDPPAGAGSAQFVVGLANPAANGRGYVRVTDVAGYRRHVLVYIDALAPLSTGSVQHTRRYVATDVPVALPDNSVVGALSSIVVPDADAISDLNLTLNITHPMDADIDLSMLSPTPITLFTDIGSTGNDFIDTTLDQDAAEPIPSSASSAPFTGTWQPESPANLDVFNGTSAAGTYTLKVVDDAQYNIGTLDGWSLTIESPLFPERFDGRATDGEGLSSGVCSIAFVPDPINLTLAVDAFAPGAKIVRYSVALANPALDGTGKVRITDCAGNFTDVNVCLVAMMPPARLGDLDGDGDLDFDDFELVAPCLEGPSEAGFPPCHPCRLADMDGDGDVDLADAALFQESFQTP